MEVGELRIGNLVLRGGVFEIDTIESSGDVSGDYPFHLTKGYQHGEIKECKPIPLTFDWARKFNFKESTDIEDNITLSLEITSDLGSHIGNDTYGIEKTGFYLVDVDGGVIGREIEYVHSLQNIYYDLEKKELEWK